MTPGKITLYPLLLSLVLLASAGCVPSEEGAKKPPQAAAAGPPPAGKGSSPLAVDKQLALLAKADGNPAPFTFVVFGDNRTSGEDPVAQPEVYHRIVEEIAGLKHVDFVIDVGDLIRGYSKDDQLINREWDEFERVSLKVNKPFLVVPGNHDVQGGNQEKIYGERFGRFHYAFRHKGACFIVLNSEDQRRPDYILSDQLAWLKEELEKARKENCRPIFVFFHKPLWKYSAERSNYNEEVHPLLARYGVAAVFAGHDHHFVDYGEKDGVHYYVTGGAGAGLAQGGELAGAFHHYLEVKVADDRSWSLTVYRPGREVVSGDFTRPERVGRLVRLKQELLARPLELSGETLKIAVPLENPLAEREISFSYRWQYPKTLWEVKPPEGSAVLQPGEMRELSFELTVREPRFPFPVPVLSLRAASGEKEVFSLRRPLALAFVRRAEAPVLERPPRIDGELEPLWEKAGRITGFLTDDGSYLANPPTVVRVARDAGHLYVAFICYEPKPEEIKTDRAKQRDDPVWKDDSVEVFVGSSQEKGLYRHLLVSAAGVKQDESGQGGAWDGRWRAAVRREPEHKRWVVEIAVPAADLALRSFAEVRSIRINFTRNRYVGKPQYSVWNCTFGSYHRPRLFGEVLFPQD